MRPQLWSGECQGAPLLLLSRSWLGTTPVRPLQAVPLGLLPPASGAVSSYQYILEKDALLAFR